MAIDAPTADHELSPTGAAASLRILLADDHNLVRDGIRALLEARFPTIQVNMAADIQTALVLAATPPGFDLVLLDFRMPGMNGTVGVERMRAILPTIPIAILSGYPCPPELAPTLSRLHVTFLAKTLSGSALISALTEVIDDAAALSLPLDTDLSDAESENAVAETRPLTKRERQVLSHLSLGLSNKEIARLLTIEEVTVRLHLRGIFRKLGVRNRTQAVRHAINLGLDLGT